MKEKDQSIKKIDYALYRRVEVDVLTQLDDGTLVWPDQVVYVEATPKQIALQHPRCNKCGHYNAVYSTCNSHIICETHPLNYCSQHTCLLEPTNEIN